MGKVNKAKKVAKPAKKAAKPMKPAKKVAKPAKKIAKPAKAAKKPAKVKPLTLKSAVKKITQKVKALSKPVKKEDLKKIKQKELELKKKADEKAKKEALKQAKLAAKEKEKQAKLAAKEKEKQAKLAAKEKEKQAKIEAKNLAKGIKPQAAVVEEKPRRRGGEDLDFLDDETVFEDDIDDLEDFDLEVDEKPRRNRSEFEGLEGRISDEITNLAEHFDWKEIHDAIVSLDYFVDKKSDECMEKACDNLRATQGYCRLHYIKNYKTIKRKKEILKEGKLQEYITELVSKYPPKFIEQMFADLHDDREFYKVLNDLGITTTYNYDEVEEVAVEAEDDDDVMIETRTIVASRIGYDDEEL